MMLPASAGSCSLNSRGQQTATLRQKPLSQALTSFWSHDTFRQSNKLDLIIPMSKFLTALPVLAALALMAPIAALAQTATPAIEDQLSLGEDTEATAELGKPYTREVIGAWEMRCIKTEDEVDPCQMYQLLDDGEGAPVAEISVFRLSGGGKAEAGATIIVPLETSLPSQLTVSVDDGKARRYPYAFCNPVGCYVRLGLTSADIAAFKKGNEATITIVPALAPDQKVALTLSLAGFTASYNEVSVVSQ
jgi:invasion protein IalB